MRSVRLEAALDRRIELAAAKEGVSVSEFIRRAAAEQARDGEKSARAVAERADAMLPGPSNLELLADVIGVAPSVVDDGGAAHRVPEVFAEAMNAKHGEASR